MTCLIAPYNDELEEVEIEFEMEEYKLTETWRETIIEMVRDKENKISDGWIETLELLLDYNSLRGLKKGMMDCRKGRFCSLNEIFENEKER